MIPPGRPPRRTLRLAPVAAVFVLAAGGLALAVAGLALTTAGVARAQSTSAQPPVGSLDPVTSGAVDSTAWVVSPADSLLEGEEPWEMDDSWDRGDSLDLDQPEAPDDTTGTPALFAPAAGRTVAPPSPPSELPGASSSPADPPRRLSKVASGVYGGYPSWGGAMIVAPADGPAAFRSGVTGLPNIGILWTPGFELRFDQPSGTFATDGGFFYGNLFLGRSYLNERRGYTAMETGLGYRWILSDRRGLRWIGAIEAGGYWRPESAWPYRPSLRAYWLLVE